MTLGKILQDNPEYIDYEISLSEILVYDSAKNNEEKIECIADFPILGLASNSDDKELRIVIKPEDKNLLKIAKNRITHILDQKGL